MIISCCISGWYETITRKRTNVSSASTPPVLPGQHITWVCTLPAHANWPDSLQTHTWQLHKSHQNMPYLHIYWNIELPQPVLIQFKFIMPDHDRYGRNDRAATQAADAHIIAHSVWQNGMRYLFHVTDYIDFITYIYYCNWFSRNPSMSRILW